MTAGIVALALFGAACSGASSPEVVDPANSAVAPADSGPAATAAATQDSSDDAAAEQAADVATPDGGDAIGVADEPEAVEDNSSAIPAPETLQFTAPLVGGGEIDLAADFDNKPTLFWFWAPT